MPGQTTLTQSRRRECLDRLGITAGELSGRSIAPAEAPAGLSLLYLLNVSNPGRLSADSGLLFADILAPALLDRGVRLTVAGPVGLSDPRVDHIEVSAPTTKYRARFGFDVDACAALLRVALPEVVAANQIEAAPGIRAAMLEVGSDALLAGYCHYLPFHVDEAGRMYLDPSLSNADLGHPVLLAFAAGLMACDRVMVHSAVARTWLHLLAERLRLDLGDRVRVVPPPADPRLLQPADRVAPLGATAVGVYNHRLYEHYGTSQFVDLARRLCDAVPVRLRVMDLFGTRRLDRTRLDASPERYRSLLAALSNVEVVSDNGDRVRYRDLLGGALFGIAPFRAGCTWSMSVIDCLGMGLPVLTPRLGWLAEIADPELAFDHPDEAVGIFGRLVSDPGFASAAGERASRRVAQLAPDIVASAYLEAISR